MNIKYLSRLICGGNSNHPVNLIENSNSAPQSSGHHHYFRWKGRFKSYPGSYQHSTFEISVGINWNPKIPKGMRLETKNGTHLIRLSDGMDFHFSAKELLRKDFCTWARKEMAKNYLKRIETKCVERNFNQIIKNTYVNLEDSRRAGNCVEGSLSFAERKLNISRENILHAPWLLQFPAQLLMKKVNNNSWEYQRVKSAIIQANLRETTVSI